MTTKTILSNQIVLYKFQSHLLLYRSVYGLCFRFVFTQVWRKLPNIVMNFCNQVHLAPFINTFCLTASGFQFVWRSPSGNLWKWGNVVNHLSYPIHVHIISLCTFFQHLHIFSNALNLAILVFLVFPLKLVCAKCTKCVAHIRADKVIVKH